MIKVALFLFAHQDDEFGVFYEIYRLRHSGYRVVVVYLTSGALDGSPRADRENESIKVLLKLGVHRDDIHFLGTQLSIPDGRLSKYADRSYQSIINLTDVIGRPDCLHFHSWEGGHQDHDAVYLIGLALGKHFDILDNSFQFPLYTGHRLCWIFFTLFTPITGNSDAFRLKIPLQLRVCFIKYVFSYRSQIPTWIGLFPFFLFHLVFHGTQILQKVDSEWVLRPPHSGKLLYERRKMYMYEDFVQDVGSFLRIRW
jgi:hypothetical protein